MTHADTADQLPAFPRLLGISLTRAEPSEVCAQMDVTEEHANRNGVMHGGAILALADAVGGTAASLNLREGEATTTIETKANFLRALPLDQPAQARCVPLHLGRKTAVFQTTITRADGKTAAIITQTQMTLDWSAPGT